ncbi:MAG: TIGR00730 family Rossman fold protein [Alphaproteobacteria bacterium]|nr:TIGR00730 family Rossman fold protein [Alphaproteobacteria bacterium]
MVPPRKLCVYCGSGNGRNPAYVAAAQALGKSLAANGIGLVYGGGSLGLMGEVARAVLQAGGHVTGIIPEFLANRERMLTDVNELIVTADMHERKMTMFARASGFVALPGGLGTLEELAEISTWAQLGQHSKPIILCSVEGYWDPLVTLLEHMRQERFIREGLDITMDVVKSAEEVVPAFEYRLKTTPDRVPPHPLINKL